jgi:hypothetical protein
MKDTLLIVTVTILCAVALGYLLLEYEKVDCLFGEYMEASQDAEHELPEYYE